MRAMLGRLLLDGATRYIGKQILVTFCVVTVGLTIMVWLTQTVRLLDLIVNRGLPFGTALYFLTLLLPKLLGIMAPITLFITLLFVYARLSTDSELVVLVAAGRSPLDLARPGIMVALLVLGFAYLTSLYLQPAAAGAFADFMFRIRNDYSQALLQQGVFSQIVPRLTFYARERDPEGRLRGVLLYDQRSPDQIRIYTAARGFIAAADGGPRVVLEDGTLQEAAEAGKDISILYFDRTVVQLSDLTAGDRSFLRNEELGLGALLRPDPAAGDAATRARMRVDGHRRLSEPLYTLAYALLGLACLLSRAGARRRPRALFGALLSAALLFAADYASFGAAVTHPELAPTLYALPVLTGLAASLALVHPTLKRIRPHDGARA
jgi:lipopolysaccharide export system permease protein